VDETLVRRSKGALATGDAVVFVIECDDAARSAIKHLLESVDLHVVPFRSAVEFLDSGIPETTCCLVLELRLPVMSGLTLQKELTKANIQVPLIFVTGHGCIATAVRAMKAGAVDFLTKPINEQHLLDAVFTALERDRLRRAQEEALSLLRKGFKSLTPRERQVLFRAAAGRLNKQIADELGVSEIMVKVHRSHAMRKMNAKSFAELVRMSDLFQSELLTTGMHESAPRAAKLRKQFR
jgi:FixJ family two-component response regulator